MNLTQQLTFSANIHNIHCTRGLTDLEISKLSLMKDYCISLLNLQNCFTNWNSFWQIILWLGSSYYFCLIAEMKGKLTIMAYLDGNIPLQFFQRTFPNVQLNVHLDLQEPKIYFTDHSLVTYWQFCSLLCFNELCNCLV